MGPVDAATAPSRRTGVVLPRVVLPVAALVLAAAGFLLLPGTGDGAAQLDAALAMLTLPGERTPCTADAQRCTHTDVAPRAATRALEKQAHDLGLHDQGVSCVPRVPAPGATQECRLTVRQGPRRLEVVATGRAGDDEVRVRLTSG